MPQVHTVSPLPIPTGSGTLKASDLKPLVDAIEARLAALETTLTATQAKTDLLADDLAALRRDVTRVRRRIPRT